MPRRGAALTAPVAFAATHADPPLLAGIPVDFILFALTLAGVALFHHHTLRVALTGLVGDHRLQARVHRLQGTARDSPASRPTCGTNGWSSRTCFMLLTGFALLSRHFEKSRVPLVLPRVLPGDWYGAFVLLLMVFVLSSFLDNIAAALIGGAMAHQLFRANVHIGYLAAIVAASNAGGAGSVVGDTTTTMMWIDGVSPLQVVPAYVASVVAVVICGIPAARMQHRLQPMLRHAHERVAVDWIRVGIVLLILLSAIIANVTINLRFAEYADYFPFIGFAVWVAIAMSLPARRPDWEVLPETIKGTVFLLSLVGCASMMPVEQLPVASWPTTLGLGFVSAVFDNIPLTALALKQGGYDWGFLAYAVGFGGSMLWFGSSAGVAPGQHVSGGAVGAAVGSPWLLGRDRLRRRLLRHAVRARLASASDAQAATTRAHRRRGRSGDRNRPAVAVHRRGRSGVDDHEAGGPRAAARLNSGSPRRPAARRRGVDLHRRRGRK